MLLPALVIEAILNHEEATLRQLISDVVRGKPLSPNRGMNDTIMIELCAALAEDDAPAPEDVSTALHQPAGMSYSKVAAHLLNNRNMHFS